MSLWDELSPPQKAGIGVAVLLAALAVGYWLGVSRANPPAAKPEPIEAIEGPSGVEPNAAGRIVVYVSGAVNEPGMVDLPSGSRTLDAIDAAGGLTSDADPGSINMAEVLKDGDHVDVGYLKGEKPSTSTAFPINVNMAGVSELEQLPGIGPALAQDIVRWRDEHGPFSMPEDLLQIGGITPAKLDAIRPYIVF